ncbi:MAG: polyprenyl synthetase family protein [Planctomycetota bacterium]
MSGFEDYLTECRQLVDPHLDRLLPQEADGALAKAMRHIVFAPGKRLRPALVLLASRHVGGSVQEAMGAACAVELIHAYSLLHDDLPCMDDAALRRGRPCAHVVFGEAAALLAGDALLTLAFEALVRETPVQRPLPLMVAELARAAGWAGMVGGQMEDLQAEGQAPDVERVRRIHLGKTAALVAVSFQLGALAGGADSALAETLGGAGRQFGLAFQIVDDLLDVEGQTEDLGKAAGADAALAKMTWPAVVGVTVARQDAARLVDEARRACPAGAADELVASLAAFLLPRRR